MYLILYFVSLYIKPWHALKDQDFAYEEKRIFLNSGLRKDFRFKHRNYRNFYIFSDNE
jgi:hypothetical protein